MFIKVRANESTSLTMGSVVTQNKDIILNLSLMTNIQCIPAKGGLLSKAHKVTFNYIAGVPIECGLSFTKDEDEYKRIVDLIEKQIIS